MELEEIFLSRFAELTPDGLFTVVGGGVNRINAGSFPWTWGIMFLLARYRLTTEEAHRRHVLSIERETPNGQLEPIVPQFPMVNMPANPEVGPDGRFGFSLNYCLTNLVFLEPGVYKYRLKMDGQEVGVAKLLVAGPSH
jgi:hypothetical protein